jgi:phosphoribosyl 1,2-cyclic phosphodiesterase
MLDSGLDLTKSGQDALPPFGWLDHKAIDAVLISHAQVDHIGALPALINKCLLTKCSAASGLAATCRDRNLFTWFSIIGLACLSPLRRGLKLDRRPPCWSAFLEAVVR